MTQRSAKHATFTIERAFDAKPARVFSAFASVEAKARWMFCHSEWETSTFEIDFRVGGREYLRTGPAASTTTSCPTSASWSRSRCTLMRR